MDSFKLFLENIDFVNSILNEFNGTNSDVTNSDVTNSDVTNSDVTNSDVTNADVTNADVTNADATNLNGVKQKVWSAKKAEIMQMWKNSDPRKPIFIQPLSDKPEGSNQTNYGEDGIRITGSFSFITSVISKLKEILNYENPKTRLRLVFKGIDNSKLNHKNQSFAFYINLEKRGGINKTSKFNIKI